ncbi:MAG: hypothetical protein J6330_03520 [Clostridia bacterium]|nr:hypothetical protein [Clostridia bacterium]
MDGFLSLGSLLSYGGSVTAVCALTQILKPLLSRLPFRVGARAVSYVTALCVMIAAALLSGKREAADYVLCFVNAALVALSANGGYDLAKALSEGEHTEDDDDDNA